MFYNYRPDGLSEKGMSKHTQEPWVLFEVGDRVKHFCPASEKEKTSILTVTLEDGTAFGAVYSEDDARRIVACVNACAGLPTEQLESSPLGGVLNGVAGLIAQRDELLAALEGVLAVVGDSTGVAGYHLNGDIADWNEFDEINAVYTAITKANGNTAAEVDSCSP